MSTVTGHCNCNKITLTMPKVDGMAYCHCTSCRRSSGSTASANLFAQIKDIELTGEPKVYAQTGSSGKEVRRKFCGDCGSPIWTEGDAFPGAAFVKAGLFDPGQIPKAVKHVFVKNLEPWEVIPEGMETNQTM